MNKDQKTEEIQTDHLIDLATKKFDADAAFDNFLTAIDNKEKEVPKKRGYHAFLKYAAIIVVCASVGFYFFTTAGGSEMKVASVSTPNGEKMEMLLPDGSLVHLNAGSTLTYRSNFLMDRSVQLTGQAYFEVKNMEDIPFIVELDDAAAIEVVGTAFDIKSYKEDGVSEITLIEGTVKLSSKKLEDEVYMTPGDKAVINASMEQVQFSKLKDPLREIAWREGGLDFQKEQLVHIVNELNRIYDVEIQITSKSLETELVTASFEEGTTILEILNALSISCDFNFQERNTSNFLIYYQEK